MTNETRELFMYDCEFIWWDDYDVPFIKSNVKCIVAGYSFADVATKLDSWYGDGIDDLSMKVIDDTDGGVYEIYKEPAAR